MELEKFTLGGLRRAVVEGDVDTGSLMAGQVAGMVNKEDTLANIIENLFKELKEEQKKIAEVNL